ncbi:MAG TPA: MarR family transcriptional regulator [Clostridia bacterium]|nr:MarR family transcriptional regulator [Clostridia bacterium]
MDTDLRDRLLQTMLRFKKLGIVFPPELDIRMGELMVMRSIKNAQSDDGKSVFISDLHGHHFMTKSAISQILNSLEKKEYVRRRIDKEDRRKIAVTLTSNGQSILARTKAYTDDMIDTVISRFGEDNTRQIIDLFIDLTDISEQVKQEFLNSDNKKDKKDKKDKENKGGNAID